MSDPKIDPERMKKWKANILTEINIMESKNLTNPHEASRSAPRCSPVSLRKNDCLQTPEWVYNELGMIDLDPCAGLDTQIGKENYRVEEGANGLNLDWKGFVYCNPPFSQKEQWAEKMITHGNGILILPERGSAPWFGPLAEAAGAYWVMGKKINFVGGPSSNNLGSVLFLFGEDARKRVLASDLPGHYVEVKTFKPRQ